jgi:hypothetical protein
MEAQPGAMETYHRAVKAYYRAIDVQPGSVEDYRRAVKDEAM